ncbi:MAG: beta-N-acetylhexosaminidase, partial [Muribaculaceae bacterium]|nr:beta-N-acetylhexosaminidase [Muribaculaceae bacterium]
MIKKLINTAILSIIALSAPATVDNLLPMPKSVKFLEGLAFKTGRGVILNDPTASSELMRFISEANLVNGEYGSGVITVKLGDVEGLYDYKLKDYPAEGYKLTVTDDTILIEAPHPMGVTRAAQTLRQLAEGGNGKIEGVEIIDWPAFKLRGFMHDVGRSFLPVEELKREIDLLSRFKVNTFHWHLTDNTGWRMEIKSYPQLTGDKSIIRYPGEFYTQDDARELQNYAAERGVTVIPEIDMPGHSGPFERSMGYSMQTEEGKKDLKIILNEVAEVFDKAPYIHIGGDEIGFNDDYLIEMIDYVHSLGKRVVIWNRYNRPPKPVNPEIIPCDMTTNWATIGRLSPGVPNVDMRYNYTNHFDVFADVVGIYKSTIFGKTVGDEDVAGTISAAWNDTKVPTHNDIVSQNNIYANILASTERAWKGGGEQYIEEGGTTLPVEGSEYEEFADWERRFLHPKSTTLAETADLIPYLR